MTKTLKKEIEKIIAYTGANCPVEKFCDKVDLYNISFSQKLSEEFIREFKDKIDEVTWECISRHQKLSEEFIREFKDKVSWRYISENQALSENFIREFKDKVNWVNICGSQKLSEEFIREFKDKLDERTWECISLYQKLSEEFIREFKDKVSWFYLSENQVLSKNFIIEFKDKMGEEDVKLNKKTNRKTTKATKIKEMKKYAEKHSLKFDGDYLYAFRNHDKWGRGIFNATLTYSKGNYYRDWHCDMRKNIANSFGLGIYPKGNTPVRVKVEDWGVCVDRIDGKCRVWGFEVI